MDKMIDYDKVNEYVTTMISKSSSCVQLTSVALDGLFGAKNQVISETDLHDGIKYIIALHKKDVEENRYASTEQKEMEKNRREFILKSLEEQIKVYLKSQNRLL